MGKGLVIYDQSDEIFTRTIVPRLFLTGLFTSAWFVFAKRASLFHSQITLNRTVPIAFLLAFYYSRGFAYHWVVMKESTKKSWEIRGREKEEYKKKLRARY